jgi:hypothetical protein
MEVVCSSEMLVEFHLTAWHYISEDRIIQQYYSFLTENSKYSRIFSIKLLLYFDVKVCPFVGINFTVVFTVQYQRKFVRKADFYFIGVPFYTDFTL